MRRFLKPLVLLSLLTGAPAAAADEYSDADLIRGFMLTVFGAEVIDAPADIAAALRVKKFNRPVRYRIVDDAGGGEAAALVRDYLYGLSRAVDGLRTVEVAGPLRAEMTIYLVDRAAYAATIERTVWEGVDTSFLARNACSAVIAARTSGIERANVYLVVDEGFLTLAHCTVEEIAQSLGPANDSDELPDSIFNDSSSVNVLGEFDWFLLNMLYDRRIVAGMTAEAVAPLLPAVIADARARLPAVLADNAALAAHRASAAATGQ